jgi:hypothetical protein
LLPESAIVPLQGQRGLGTMVVRLKYFSLEECRYRKDRYLRIAERMPEGSDIKRGMLERVEEVQRAIDYLVKQRSRKAS